MTYLLPYTAVYQLIEEYNQGLNDHFEIAMSYYTTDGRVSSDGILTDRPIQDLTREYYGIADRNTNVSSINYISIWYQCNLSRLSIIYSNKIIDDQYVLHARDPNDRANLPGFNTVPMRYTPIDARSSPLVSYDTSGIFYDYLRDPTTTNYNLLQGHRVYVDMMIRLLRTLPSSMFNISNQLSNRMVDNLTYDKRLRSTKRYNSYIKSYIESVTRTDRVVSTNLDQLSEEYHSNRMNKSLQDNISTLIRSITQHSDGFRLSSDTINRYAITYRGSLLDRFNILIKTNYDDDEDDRRYDWQYYETYIGLRLNSLREMIPNFMMSYTVSELLVDRYMPRVVTRWNCGDQLTPVLFLEYIDDSVTLSEWIQSNRVLMNSAGDILSSGESLLVILLQIMMSLRIAYDSYQFIHRDLHDENILIRELSKSVWIDYGDVSVYSKYVAVIIDYGQSSIDSDIGYIISPIAGPEYPDPIPQLDILQLLSPLVLREGSIDYIKIFLSLYETHELDDRDVLSHKNTLTVFIKEMGYPPDREDGIYLDHFYNRLIEMYRDIEPGYLDELMQLNTQVLTDPYPLSVADVISEEC